MNLAQLQQKFQACVLSGEADETLLAAIKPPPADAAQDRFAIYSDGYRLRHAEFLSNDFPALREAVGDEIFGAIVEAYIGAHPSHFRNARWYGGALPDFVLMTPPFSDNAFACALAALEGALGDAFDAAEATPLAIDALAAVAMEDWPALHFRFHPAATLVETSAGAIAAYSAFHQEGEIEPEAGEPCDALVWRDGLDVRYRALSALEKLAAREAFAGARFGDICGLIAFSQPEASSENLTAQAAGFLAQWFADGLVVEAGIR